MNQITRILYENSKLEDRCKPVNDVFNEFIYQQKQYQARYENGINTRDSEISKDYAYKNTLEWLYKPVEKK